MDQCLFQFRVGFTTTRPVVVDEHVTFVSLMGEDSPQGLLDTRQLVTTWVHLKYDSEMVTSVELLGVEL